MAETQPIVNSQEDPFEKYKVKEVEADPFEKYKVPEEDPFAKYKVEPREQEKEEPGFFGKALEALQIRTDPKELTADIQSRVSPEERKKLDEEALKTPVISGKVEEMRILPSELEGIARKHNIPVSNLTSFDWAAFFGAPMATGGIGGELAQVSEGLLGSLSEAVAMGLPQKLAIKFQSDPKMEAALDDLRTIALAKKSGLLQAAELGGALATGYGLAKVAGTAAKAAGAGETAAKAATIATGVGEAAAATYAGAEKDYESKAVMLGAGLGGAVAAGVEVFGLIRNVRARRAAEAAEAELAESPDMVRQINEQVSKTQNAQQTMDTVIDRAVAAKGKEDIEKLSKEINSTEGLYKLLGKGDTEAGKKAVESASEEIFNGLSTEGQRKLLTDLKDGRLLDAENKVSELGRTVIVQKYLDENLPRIAGKVQEGTQSMTGSLTNILSRAGEGAEFLKGEFRRVLQQNAANKLISDRIIARAGLGEAEGPVLRNIAQGFTDAQFVLRGIDRRAGTRLEVTLNKGNNQYNAFTRMLAQIVNDREVMGADGVLTKIKGLASLDKMKQAANLSDDDLYKFLDKGITEIPDPKKADVVNEYRKWFASARTEANEQGLNIADFVQKYGGYVPHSVLDRIEIAKRLRDGITDIRDRFGINLMDYGEETYTKAAEAGLRNDVNYRRLKDSLEYLNGGAIQDADTMRQVLARQINPRTAGIRDTSNAAAVYRRSVEEVPEMIRETNVTKLAARWASNTFKHAFMRDTFAEMENVRDILIRRGFHKDAEYLSNLLTDNLGGVRSNTWRAATQQFANALLDIRDNRSADSQLRRIAEWMLEAGESTSSRMFGAVYPNFLGANIRSALQNMSQPILVTAPELGAAGMGYVMRALKNVALNPLDTVRQGGQFRAAQWNTELMSVLESQIKRSWIGAKTDALIDTYTKYSMALYETAERANRVIVVQMGKELTKDLLSGNQAAKLYVQKLNPGMRRAVKEAIEKGDDQALEGLLINNLLDKTVFQYNKLSMSAFGRAAGPVLSTFSKWPTAIAGDVIDAYARKGIGAGSAELGGRYLAPFMMLGVINAAVMSEDKSFFSQEDPQIQALIGGKKGLTGLSPLASLTQGIGTPPIVTSTGKFAKALIEGDIDKAGSALASLGDAYIPMLPGILRTWNDATKLTSGDENEVKSLETLFEAVTE